MNNLMLTLNLS